MKDKRFWEIVDYYEVSYDINSILETVVEENKGNYNEVLADLELITKNSIKDSYKETIKKACLDYKASYSN